MPPLDFHNWKEIQAAIGGTFALLAESSQERNDVMALVALYHYRDGRSHPDGSMGTIDISPGQLRDLLAYVMTERR